MMNKDEFVELLKGLGIQINEGITPEKAKGNYPRIIMWSYVSEFQAASGSAYNDVKTYQVSFMSMSVDDPKLQELRTKMLVKHLLPRINHEYIEEDRIWHSFFSVDLIENVIEHD